LGKKIQELMAKRHQDDTYKGVSAPANEITVTNSADHGIGSLRSSIDQANTNPGPDVILFFHVKLNHHPYQHAATYHW
jgi:hypothetical protein